jgi:protein SCO1/2
LTNSRSPRITLAIALGLALTVLAGACRPAPKQYALTGQILGVDVERRQITLKHDDLPNFMPAMTMTYPVSSPALLDGRTPGELVSATLEVDDATGRLTAITRTGLAPLPEGNAVAMATDRLDVGAALPDVALVDQTGRRRTLAEWRGSLTVITFTYTRCPLPTFCPLMDQNFVTLQGAIVEDASLRGRVRLVTITFDPAHDTPAILAAHAAKMRADPAVWTWLTGDVVTIDRLAGRFGVGVLRGDDPAQITHSLRTAIVGTDGRLLKIYSGNDWTPGAILADLRAAAGAP